MRHDHNKEEDFVKNVKEGKDMKGDKRELEMGYRILSLCGCLEKNYFTFSGVGSFP